MKSVYAIACKASEENKRQQVDDSIQESTKTLDIMKLLIAVDSEYDDQYEWSNLFQEAAS